MGRFFGCGAARRRLTGGFGVASGLSARTAVTSWLSARTAVVPAWLSLRIIAGLLVLALAGLMGMGPGAGLLAAQEDDEPGSQDVALLTDGPELARGLPFLPANVIQHYRGRYEYLNNEIDVFYTEKEMLRFSSWQPVDCEGYRLYRLAGAGQSAGQSGGAGPIVPRPVFFYQTDQYALFIRVDQQYLCTFFPRFMSKFIYFRSVQDIAANRPPFPAVVD